MKMMSCVSTFLALFLLTVPAGAANQSGVAVRACDVVDSIEFNIPLDFKFADLERNAQSGHAVDLALDVSAKDFAEFAKMFAQPQPHSVVASSTLPFVGQLVSLFSQTIRALKMDPSAKLEKIVRFTGGKIVEDIRFYFYMSQPTKTVGSKICVKVMHPFLGRENQAFKNFMTAALTDTTVAAKKSGRSWTKPLASVVALGGSYALGSYYGNPFSRRQTPKPEALYSDMTLEPAIVESLGDTTAHHTYCGLNTNITQFNAVCAGNPSDRHRAVASGGMTQEQAGELDRNDEKIRQAVGDSGVSLVVTIASMAAECKLLNSLDFWRQFVDETNGYAKLACNIVLLVPLRTIIDIQKGDSRLFRRFAQTLHQSNSLKIVVYDDVLGKAWNSNEYTSERRYVFGVLQGLRWMLVQPCLDRGYITCVNATQVDVDSLITVKRTYCEAVVAALRELR